MQTVEPDISTINTKAALHQLEKEQHGRVTISCEGWD